MLNNHNYQRIQIAMIADWQYVSPLETTIKSIAFHNRNTTIYVVNPDIPREWFQKLNAVLAPLQNEVVDMKITTDRLKNQHVSMIHINYMASARLLLPKLLECDRVLYLDSDIIVNHSLQSLFNANLNSHPIGAVYDIHDKHFFNDGIMVMDLQRLRSIPGLVDKLLEYGTQDLPDGDQSVMNHFFGDDLQPLDDHFNVQVGLESNWDDYGQYDDNPAAKAAFDQMENLIGDLANIVIIHYVCPDKPWSLTSKCRYRNIWWQYYQLSWAQIISHQLPPLHPITAPLMTLTFTDNMLHLPELLPQFQGIDWNVCAPTPVSFYLKSLSKYPNYHLFPQTLSYYQKYFANTCQVYLDINVGAKDHDVLQKMIDRHCPIFTWESVAAPELKQFDNYHVFPDDQVDKFAAAVKAALHHVKEKNNG